MASQIINGDETACDGLQPVPSKRRKVTDDNYFQCYENFDIHATMISDRARTVTYRRAIFRNYLKLYKTVVADIGSGTGILSIFCAQAGAKRVLAVEGSALASTARDLIAANGLEGRIEVLNSRAEDVILTEKVDAIVSEWMGYGLLYENMLSSVIDFRDKHLKKDGLMFPQTANVFLAALGDVYGDAPTKEIAEMWQRMGDLYDVKFDPTLTAPTLEQFSGKAHVEVIPIQGLISDPCEIFSLDLLTVTKAELSPIKKPFKLVCFGEAELVGMVMWFDVSFPCGLCLSTSPSAETTHWQQVAIYFKQHIKVEQDSILEGTIEFRQADDFHRFLDICVNAQCYSPNQRHEPTQFEQLIKFREG